MPKYEVVSGGGEYAPVADRITLFYARYPTGRILTRLVSRTEHEITVQAFIYRSVEEIRPSATGLAAERIGDGDVNTVACLENTETSAIGRALANLGLTASHNRPSREEMDKAHRERVRRVAEPFVRRSPGSTARPSSLTISPQAAASAALQRRANRVFDALDLLNRAERAGLPPVRARRLHCMLTEPTATVAIIERVERMLRSWTAWRQTAHLRL
jgi:hypothetical protein